MSDLIIPGVRSNINSERMIEGLMKIERIPLERLEARNELSRQERQVWQTLNRKIGLVRDSARHLYSFQNPFDDKRVISSDSSVLTATATRGAIIESRNLKVVETASADRFRSNPIPRNERVEAGSYVFIVGENRVSFNFRGGTLREFEDAINRNGRDNVRASVVNYNRENIVFVIESQRTGSDNILSFEGKAADFALRTGIMKRSRSADQTINISAENIREWTVPINRETFTIEGNSLTVKSGKELRIDINPAVATRTAAAGNMVLEFNINVRNLPEAPVPEFTAPAGPTIPEAGRLTFENIVIQNNPFEGTMPAWTPPAGPENITDLSVLFLGAGNRIERLDNIRDTEETQTIQIPLSQIANPLSSINIRNRNTLKEITISDIRVYNPEARGDIVPANPISTASDAIVEVDGIRVRRPSNTIDDLIPEITLNLRAPGPNNVTINVEPDIIGIKSSIITFVGHYNNLIAELNILSRNSDEIINEITHFTDEERRAARERLGIFQGDSSINQMRDRLQRIMSAPHNWNDDSFFTLLAHIGISTNSGLGAGAHASRLRGYLEINERVLDEAIENNPAAIKNLFGFDRTSNMIIDSGVAFEVDNYLRAFNESGGIISQRIRTINQNISRTETEITNFNNRLARIEQDLRRRYGIMEGTLQELERAGNQFRNLPMNNNNSR
ncbi:MAG: flagellar filament capping protein FliD [Spirochaetes bacterium]|nr:flagellar filament capping protein FliD [Spirochaetota bacterium]